MTLDGIKCDRVLVVLESGRERVDFFSTTGGLLVACEENGGLWRYDDYRDFGGIKVACVRTFERGGLIEERISIEDVSFAEIPDEEFDLERQKPHKPKSELPVKKNSAGAVDSIDELILRHMRERLVPGLSLAIVRHGKIEKVAGYGFADVAKEKPALPETRYHLASLTKTFTATSAMFLVERNKLSLDESVARFFINAPKAWSSVTLRHLLHHTSGLPQEAYGWFSLPKYENDAMRAAIFQTPFEYTPGERATYSNPGYLLLGMIISEAAKTNWFDFLKANLLTEVMTNTALAADSAATSNRAKGYALSFEGDLVESKYPPAAIGGAAGALESTVLDLAHWVIALESGRIIRRSTLERMYEVVRLKNGTYSQSGLGWFVDTVNGHRVIGHGGDSGSFKTQLTRFPNAGITVIILANGSPCDAKLLVRQIAETFRL